MPWGVVLICVGDPGTETPLVAGEGDAVGRFVRAASPALDPATVADMVVEGIRNERFLIMTHPETADAAVLLATDANAYLEVMSGLWSAAGGTPLLHFDVLVALSFQLNRLPECSIGVRSQLWATAPAG